MPGALITKKALAHAMRTLMQEEAFRRISVGDICERCGMSRKSFYYHFRDKYELVNWIFDQDFIALVRDRSYDNAWEFFEDLCTYFYENRTFYVNAFAVEGQNSFTEYFAEVLQPIAQDYFMRILGDDRKKEFFAVFFMDAFRVSLIRWLREPQNLSPSEYIALLKVCIVGVAKRVVEGTPSEAEGKEKDE